MTLFVLLPFAGFYLGIKYQEMKRIINNPASIPITKEIYPECIAGLCPTYSQIDAIPSDVMPETAIVIPLAMTQGFGKLVIVGDGGKKLFDSGGLPGIWVKPVDDGNGFILKYTGSTDENLERESFDVRYIWRNGKFVEK